MTGRFQSILIVSVCQHIIIIDSSIKDLCLELIQNEYTITFVLMHFSVNKDCLREKNCSQLCRQTQSGAVCFCKPGYVLDSDGISCKGKCKLL